MTQRVPVQAQVEGMSYVQLAEAFLDKTAKELAGYTLPLARLVPNRGVTLNNLTITTAGLNNVALTWPTDGIVLGVRASTQDGLDASMAGTSLRIQVDGDTDLFSSGSSNGAGYLPLALISGVNSTQGVWTFQRGFWQASQWLVSLDNNTGGDVTADLFFDIIDIRRVAALPE